MITPVNLPKLHAPIQAELEEAVLRVMRSAAYCLGPEVEAFETRFAAYCAADHAIGVNSGTSALHLALLSQGVGPGDEVITSPFSFIASSASIRYCGARPVYVDIDPDSFLMETRQIEDKITPQTKALLPVHLYGQMVDMDSIRKIADQHGLAVAEDAAQAHGSEWKNQRPGTFGYPACYSFYPTKNLGGCGEGGMIVGDDPTMRQLTSSLRSWGTGQPGQYDHVLEGFNYRLEGIQAAVLNVKLHYLEDWIARRQDNAALYRELLDGTDVVLPTALPDRRHVYHQFTIRVARRDQVVSRLKEFGIIPGIFYPLPLHLQPAYSELGYQKGDFPEAEKAAGEVLQLPVGPELGPDEIRQVAQGLQDALAS